MKISEKLFFLSYGIYLLFCILNTSFYSLYISSFMKPVMIVCVTLELIRECFCMKLSRKEVFFLLICIVLSSILSLNLNGIAMLPLFVFIYGARTIEFKKIARFTVFFSSILLCFIFISAKLGIITNYILKVNERKREYLGFRYPLFPQMILFNITLSDLYANKGKLTKKKCLFLILINYILFKYTDSRLSFYLSIFLIISIFAIDRVPKILDSRRILCYLLIFSFPIFCMLSLYITSKYEYSNSTLRKLDKLLEARLSLGKASMSEYKIKLFGNDIEYIGAGLDTNGKRSKKKYNYVDCMYINLLEKYGIIFNVIFLSLLTYLEYKAWKNKDYILLAILCGLAIRGLIDDLEIYLYYNVFWLSISKYLKKKNESTKEESLNKMAL